MGEIRPARTVICFCCGEELSSAARGDDPWNSPGDGVRFSADVTYGSGFYDAMTEEEGVSLQVVICDQCLENNKARARKVKYNTMITQEVIGDIKGIAEDAIAKRISESMEDKDECDSKSS